MEGESRREKPKGKYAGNAENSNPLKVGRWSEADNTRGRHFKGAKKNNEERGILA